MRVLHVSSYFAPAFVYGGPPRSVRDLCAALGEAGVDVEVFTTTANGDEELPASPEGGDLVDGIRVRFFPRAFPRRFFAASGLWSALATRVADFDLVHVHGLWNVPGWLAIESCRRAGVPYVVSPRGMLDTGSLAYHRTRKAICYRLLERRNLARAALLHATSASEAESISQHRLGPKVVVVPNGVTLPTSVGKAGFRNRWDLPGDALLVVFLGRLHPVKRIDLLVAAFDAVLTELPGARLVLAGRADGLDPASIAGGRLGREILWLGPLGEEDKWELLSEASALVQCSDSESFGMSVLEALAAGVPVVATRTCPWKEIGTRGCGLWIDQRADSIADALVHILGDPERARQMGERGSELARERYRWSVVARDMAGHYGDLLANPSIERRRAS